MGCLRLALMALPGSLCCAQAPEVVRREPQAEPADWWSLGVTLLYAATGTHPFRVRHPAVDYPPPPPVQPPAPASDAPTAGVAATAAGGAAATAGAAPAATPMETEMATFGGGAPAPATHQERGLWKACKGTFWCVNLLVLEDFSPALIPASS